MKNIHRHLILIVPIFLLGISYCSALTLGVALDGSQPFSSIQSAVQVSAYGDTVLVYPGRYIENVDYIGKNITIASLELITGNSAYRDSTIIDGNRNGSVIKSISGIDQAGIFGISITNGSGSPLSYFQGIPINLGGGVVLRDADSFHVTNCIIEHNVAEWGGGFWVHQSNVFASGSVVRDNFSSIGGGVYLTNHGQIVFDQINRCSIYRNTSGSGMDIVAADSRLETNIYLDMGTLCPTTDYYIKYAKSAPDWPGGFPIIDILQAYTTEVNQHLFVSPNGNDMNNGLSISTPMKSIYRAMQMVASDSLNPKTVHLSSGVYSSNDGQFFPIALKSYVTILGDPFDQPLIDNRHYRNAFSGSNLYNSAVVNLVIAYQDNVNGAVAFTLSRSEGIKLRNIEISPHQSNTWKGIFLGSNGISPASFDLDSILIAGQSSPYNSGLLINTADATINRLIIDDCHTSGDELDNPYSLLYYFGNILRIENSQITNNSVNYEEDYIVSIGMRHADSSSRLIMNNVLVANNQSGGESPVYIAAFTDSTSLISNCTFANNRGSYFAATLKGNLQVSNCIFDNDTPAEILIENTQPNFTSTITFNNNFIRGYPQSFSSVSANQISFNDVVLTGSPGFCDLAADDPLSYRLGNSSICRDTGTPDTTGLHLPAFDCYGNPRIYNGIIDIGCSEWNSPLANSEEYQAPPASLQVYPNPFSSEAKISFSLEKDAIVQLKIFNLRGQLLRTMNQPNLPKGEHSLTWNGRDDQDRSLASGIYLLRLDLNGEAYTIRKVLKLQNSQ